ncbi:hypothetical protein MMC32_005996 [Xylographa parallela]|nr:hypothetical protein [Xylographa parallela]
MTEWGKAIELLACTVDLPNLTLILDFDSASYARDERPSLNAPPHEVELLDPYQRVLQPFLSLRGIGNFFVRLSPRRLAYILEKSIMGEDYDAVANGKLQHRRKLWNDGMSLERVYGPDGRKIWPLSYLVDETESDARDEEELRAS